MNLLTNNPKVQFRINSDFDTLGLGWKGEYQRKLDLLGDVHVTYNVFKKNFFVISGLRDDKVYYLKEIPIDVEGVLVFGSLEVTFPQADKATWDPILTVCANSLKSTITPGYFKSHSLPLSDLTDEKWSENFDSLQIEESEIPFLAELFNFNEKEKNILKGVLENKVIRVFGGNAYFNLEDQAEYGDTKEKREKAQKKLETIEKERKAEQIKEWKIERIYVRKFRAILKGRDDDFFEWNYEESIIRSIGPSLENFKQPKINAVMTVLKKPVFINEEAVLANVFNRIENNYEFQLYKLQKSKLLGNQIKANKYFDLWKNSIKDRVLFLYKATNARQPQMAGDLNEATPDELARLQKEIMDLNQKMNSLVTD